MFIEIIDFDSENEDELIDRFVPNITIPVGNTTEQEIYSGIFGLAEIVITTSVTCKAGFMGEHCENFVPIKKGNPGSKFTTGAPEGTTTVTLLIPLTTSLVLLLVVVISIMVVIVLVMYACRRSSAKRLDLSDRVTYTVRGDGLEVSNY